MGHGARNYPRMSVRMDFRSFLEDGGPVYPQANDGPYAARCVRSGIVALDRICSDPLLSKKPAKMFGKKPQPPVNRHKGEPWPTRPPLSPSPST